jgi:hypothetical protein
MARRPAAHVRAKSAAWRIAATGIAFAKRLVQSSLAVLAILILSVVLYGLLLRFVAPRPLIAVDPFEVPAELTKEIGIDGKNAADIFVDQVNETAKAAQAFRGSVFSSKHHYGHVPNLFRVPVQSSYGLQISGISIDDLISLYRRVRYDQWKVSGDIFKNGSNITVRVRFGRGQDSQDWEISPAQDGKAEAAVRLIAREMLAANQPEAMGRAYLEWGLQAMDPAQKNALYAQAVDNFRSWAMSGPENALPFYYMAVAYSFKREQQNSLDLAIWSEETAGYSKEWAQARARPVRDWLNSFLHRRGSLEALVDYDQWLIADAEMQDTTAQADPMIATAPSMPPDGNPAALRAQTIEDILAGLVAKYPADLEYQSDFADSRTRNAVRVGNKESAYPDYLRAVVIQREVVRREPDNPGFQMNLAGQLIDLAAADGEIVADTAHSQPGHNKEAAHKEIVRCLSEAKQASARALHLLPDAERALEYFTDVIMGRDDLGAPLPRGDKLAERNEGVRLCRTAILLAPDSSAVKKTYARYLLALYLTNQHAAQPEKTVLPDVEKHKATRLLDEQAVKQAWQGVNEEVATLLGRNQAFSKERQAQISAAASDSVAKSVSEFNHELGLDDAAGASR